MPATEARARPGAVTTIDTVLLESVVETADTRTLVLGIRSEPGSYRAGQYITIDPHQFAGLRGFVAYFEDAKGRREAPRAYSMSSAPHEPYVAVTIKEEVYESGRTKYPPLLSGFLVHHLHAGDRLAVRAFAGAYTLPDDVEHRAEHVLHLCAGSGSVPNVSILKDSLHRHPRLRHTLIYSNRSWNEIIFRDALAQLQQQYRDRLRVIHTLTREAGPLAYPGEVRSGRVGADLVQEVLAAEPTSLAYVCGPAITVWERRACAQAGTTPSPKFLEAMRSHLDGLGIPRERIKVEAFG